MTGEEPDDSATASGGEAGPEAAPRRSAPRFTPAWSTLALVAGLALAAASLAAEPPRSERIVTVAPDGTQTEASTGPTETTPDGTPAEATAGGGTKSATPGAATGGPAGTRTGGNAAVTGVGPGQTVKGGIECAPGRNGGSTDVGVTGTEIKLGSTVVQSGIGASFLGDVRFAMEAVKNKANAAGGICGRQLKLILKDDGWSPQRGAEYIRNLVEDEKVFALAVVPSSEGLKSVSDAGYLKEKKIPVVGSDGMLIHQYTDPYIWPVAASTISTMHIMVRQAYDAGARHFGLVYESNYHFGIEGAYAFNAAVQRVTGSPVPGYSNPLTGASTCQKRFCGISSEAPSYGSDVKTFGDGCANQQSSGGPPPCDFMALLLEPTTAIKWMKAGTWGGMKMAGPQPLFTFNFGDSCGSRCDQMWLWTGYYPPLGDNLSRPAVATYVEDIKSVSSSADYNNSFVEGGYVGMRLVVESLKATGPNLTRDALRRTLDSMTFDSGLAPPLTWTEGNHFANTKMRAYSIQYKSGFAGWRDEQVELTDPWVGQDSGS